MDCIYCKEVVEENNAVFLSDKVSQELGLPRQTALNRSGHYAHAQRVAEPGLLEPNSFSKWNMLETLRLAEETKLAKQANTRLENAILELPEELAPVFRDELHHIRDTNGDQ